MLKVRNLSYSGDTVELNNIEFDVDSGDFYVIFGPDDSGKTEILNMIMDIEKPYKGDILYKDKKIRRLGFKERMTIRYVPDSIVLENGVKGRNYIDRYMKIYNVGEVDYLNKLLDYFDINADEYLVDMTYENNKMISVIAAILTFPELLILDEPSNFLSDAMMSKLLILLGKLNKSGMTIIITAEHFEEVEGYCNRLMYVNDGEIINKCKVRRTMDVYRKVMVKEGDFNRMERAFGAPVSVDKNGRTYITGMTIDKISLVLSKCKVKDSDVNISSARIEDMLDIRYKNEKEER